MATTTMSLPKATDFPDVVTEQQKLAELTRDKAALEQSIRGKETEISRLHSENKNTEADRLAVQLLRGEPLDELPDHKNLVDDLNRLRRKHTALDRAVELQRGKITQTCQSHALDASQAVADRYRGLVRLSAEALVVFSLANAELQEIYNGLADQKLLSGGVLVQAAQPWAGRIGDVNSRIETYLRDLKSAGFPIDRDKLIKQAEKAVERAFS